MNRSRLIAVVLVGALVAVIALGWFVGVSPILTQAAAADSQRDNVKSLNDGQQVRLIGLKAQFSNLSKSQAELAALRGSIPTDIDMPVFLREINAYTAQFGVSLTSVAVADAILYAPPAVAGAATPAPAAAATPAPATAVAPVATSSLVVIPVRIIVSGGYDNVMAFVAAIQGGPRLYLVTNAGMAPVEGGFSVTIDGNAYALPLTAGQAADAVAAAKTPAATPTPTATPAPVSTPTPTPTPTKK